MIKQDFIYDPSLVLYLPLWKLDGASFADHSAYGHLCTVTGALWTPNGRKFDGDDYIDCGTGASINLVQEFTLEAWFKFSNTGSNEFILYKGNESGIAEQAWFIMKNTSEKIRLASSDDSGFLLDFAANTTLTVDTFYHAVCTYDKDTGLGIIYLNGINDGSSTISGTIPDNAPLSLTLGARDRSGEPAPNDVFLTGTIGEVRIYNRILTPLEIQNNYLATKWRYR